MSAKKGKPTRASQIMDSFTPQHKTEANKTVDEVRNVKQCAHELLGSVAQYAPVLQSPEMEDHPRKDDVIRFAKGIVEDTKALQAKMQPIDQEFNQLEALATTAYDDPGAVLVKAIKVSQDYQDVMADWDHSVKPNIDHLNDALTTEEKQ